MEQSNRLHADVSETVAYAPEIQPNHPTHFTMSQKITHHSDHEEDSGTLERLVKPEDVSYDVPPEDAEEKDQQPLGIVESCFPYLARRGPHHGRPHNNSSKSGFGLYPGMKSCFVSVGLMEEDGCSCTTSPKQSEGDLCVSIAIGNCFFSLSCTVMRQAVFSF